MKSDSGRGHRRKRFGIFKVLVVIRGNFDGTRNRVAEGWSRGGGRRLCKVEVGWIVDWMLSWLASWSLWSDVVGRSARKTALVTACHMRKGKWCGWPSSEWLRSTLAYLYHIGLQYFVFFVIALYHFIREYLILSCMKTTCILTLLIYSSDIGLALWATFLSSQLHNRV